MKSLELKPFTVTTCNGTHGVGYTTHIYRDLKLRMTGYQETHRAVVEVTYRGASLQYMAFERPNLVRGLCLRSLVMDGAYKAVGQRFIQGKAGSSVEGGRQIFSTVEIASRFIDRHSAEIANIVRRLVAQVQA